MDFKTWQQEEVYRHRFMRGVQLIGGIFLLFLLWVAVTGGGVE